MEWLQENWSSILNAVAYIISAASVIVKLTPTVKDDNALAKVVNLLQVIALNKK